MGALTRSIPVAMLMLAPPAWADGVGDWRAFVEEASTRFGIPTGWIERVIQAESRGLTILDSRPIRSRAGAMGLMQLMPATWAEMRARLSLGSNPDDPRDNILAGSFFLRLMYDRFGYPGLFGAYNAGPGAYAAFRAGRRALPAETMAYLDMVGGAATAAPRRRTAPQPVLFVIRRDADPQPSPPVPTRRAASLFAVRKVAP